MYEIANGVGFGTNEEDIKVVNSLRLALAEKDRRLEAGEPIVSIWNTVTGELRIY